MSIDPKIMAAVEDVKGDHQERGQRDPGPAAGREEVIWEVKDGWLISGIFAMRINVVNHLCDLLCNGVRLLTSSVGECQAYANALNTPGCPQP